MGTDTLSSPRHEYQVENVDHKGVPEALPSSENAVLRRLRRPGFQMNAVLGEAPCACCKACEVRRKTGPVATDGGVGEGTESPEAASKRARKGVQKWGRGLTDTQLLAH